MAKAIAVEEEQSTGLSRFRSQPQRLAEFIHNVRSEMRKVVSPTWDEVVNGTIVVLATVFFFAAFFTITDYVFGHSVPGLIHYFTVKP